MLTLAPTLEPLEEAKTVDDVVRNLDRVIDWSIRAQSTIGYFAAIYKRATIAIREALNEGKFNDCPRMEQFDLQPTCGRSPVLNGWTAPSSRQGRT